MLSIRDATSADLPAVQAMNQAAQPAVSDMPLEEALRFLGIAAYFRLAVQGDAIAGFLIGLEPGADYASMNYGWFCERYDSFVYVDRIVVAEGFRGNGVGGALYADFEHFGRERGVPRMTCEVNTRPRNTISLRFHAKAGFEEVGTQDTEGGRKTVVMLVKEFRAAPAP